MAIRNEQMEADFWHDWEQLAARLIEADGFDLGRLRSDRGETRSLQFFSLIHRLVVAAPRSVHVHPALVCPPHHEAGYRMLIDDVTSGRELAHRMSRKAHRVGFHDAMFNDWGIHHFHLGTTRDVRGRWSGAREVAFAIVRPEDFYVIGVQPHDALDFVDVGLLEKTRLEWPHLIEPFVLRAEGVSHSPTPTEHLALRRAGINVITQLATGEVLLGPGGGVTTAGGPLAARRLEIEFRQWLRDAENRLGGLGASLEREILSHCPQAARPHRFKLEREHGRFLAVLAGTPVSVDLGEPG